MKHLLIATFVLGLCGCQLSADSDRSSNIKIQHFDVQFDAFNASYVTAQYNGNSWTELDSTNQVLQISSQSNELDLVQICENVAIVKYLAILEDRSINQYWCDWLAFNDEESFAPHILLEAPPNYEIMSAASSNGNGTDYFYDNKLMVYYDEKASIHSIAVIAKRLSDQKLFFFYKDGYVFNYGDLINVDFNSESVHEISIVELPDIADPEYYHSYLRYVVLDNSIELPLWSDKNDELVYYSFPQLLTNEDTYYIENLFLTSGGVITHHVDKLGTNYYESNHLPRKIKPDDIQISQDRKSVTIRYPTSSLPEALKIQSYILHLSKETRGSLFIIEVDEKRFNGVIELQNLSMLPNIPSEFNEITFDQISLSLRIGNKKPAGDGATYIHLF